MVTAEMSGLWALRYRQFHRQSCIPGKSAEGPSGFWEVADMGQLCQGAHVARWAHLVLGSPCAKLMPEGLNLLSDTELRCDPGGTQ